MHTFEDSRQDIAWRMPGPAVPAGQPLRATMHPHLRAISNQLEATARELEAVDNSRIMAAMLAACRPALYGALARLGGWLNDFYAAYPTDNQIAAVRNEVIDPVREWSLGSPFFRSAYLKPRGYPGDYLAIETIYRNQPAGDDLVGLILDDCYLHSVACQSVRNRLDSLATWLLTETLQRRESTTAAVRLLSLGSGPARELAILSADPAFAQSVAVTCVDLDPCALDYAAGLVDGSPLVRVSFVCENVLRFATGPNRPALPFDIIYAAGLFDYLNARRSARLIDDLHGLLAPGGKLLIGNFSLETPPDERSMLDWLFDWPLIYRDEAMFREIFASTPFGASSLRFAYEPLRANLFAIASCHQEDVDWTAT